jgi:hypothetical protein
MFMPSEQTKVFHSVFAGIKCPLRSLPTITSERYRLTGWLVKDSVLYFVVMESKEVRIGIAPEIAKPLVGSYDFKKNILTVLVPEVHKDEMYVNSKWEIHKEPYKGDVINSYNDGPLQDGSQMGPFYEVESSSPAKELKAGEVQEYHQTTAHFEGDYNSLHQLTKQLFNIDLDDVKRW